MKEDKNLLLRLPKIDAERFTTAPEDRNTYTWCFWRLPLIYARLC
jgi:hypothetical protein